MYIALSLVGITFLTSQCHSGATSEDDRQYTVKMMFYEPTDLRNIRPERPLQQVSRASEQYQYQYATNSHFETQYGPNFQARGQPLQRKPLPVVEQYLKEVKPTTQTLYDPRNANYVRENNVMQYNYGAEFERKPLYQQHLEVAPKIEPVAQNILAYENARIAHQNALYEQQRAEQLQKQQNAALYVTESIQKPPALQKIIKSEPSDLEDEISYYTKLQYEQQIKQENEDFEVKQPESPKYQARIPQNAKPELLAAEEENAFLYQPKLEYNEPSPIVKSAAQPSDIKYPQKVFYQPRPENADARYYNQPRQVQRQFQPSEDTYGSDQKRVRYNEPPQGERSRPYTDDELREYKLLVAKYHAIHSSKPVETAQQVSSQYAPEAQSQHAQRYVPQQYSKPGQVQPQNPAYLGPTDEEYKQSQFKQSLGRNSSLRVLKTGKPVVFVGHEE